jgi:hypothetical protein
MHSRRQFWLTWTVTGIMAANLGILGAYAVGAGQLDEVTDGACEGPAVAAGKVGSPRLEPVVSEVDLIAAQVGDLEAIGEPLPLPRLEDLAGWQLVDGCVTDLGTIHLDEEGTRITGYTIEARAVPVVADGSAMDGGTGVCIEPAALRPAEPTPHLRWVDSPVASGRFRVSFTIFSPAKSGNGRMVGQWYVDGTWTLEVPLRHMLVGSNGEPGTIHGELVSQLPFNPVVEPGAFAADVQVTDWPAAGWRPRQDGILRFDRHLRASLALPLEPVRMASAG